MPHSSEQVTFDGRRRNGEHDPLVGTMLDDRFLIEARIATGGFGAIYRARTTDGQLLAVKILHPRLTDDPNMVARFRREGATLLQLHDPHTVTTLAVGEARDGTLYIAMELLTGVSLHDRLQRDGALPWQAAVAIARAVCSSLAEAHALGVVHRDLKPDNIHIESGPDGADQVKVIDFGIVKIARGSSIDDGKELTFAGHMIGTYDYMSPEQIVGAPCHGLSDIYSLGVVTYEMLTGRRPFAEVTGPASMMAALLTQTPAPPSILAAIPPELDRIVMRCLERDAEDRFPSIGELALAFDRLLTRRRSQREDITVEQPVCDAIPTAQFELALPPDEVPNHGEGPTRVDRGAGLLEEERAWLGPEGGTVPDVTRFRATPRPSPAPALHHEACPQHKAPFGLLPNSLDLCGPDPLFATLPGLAVAVKPRTVRDSRPALPVPALALALPVPALALPTTYPVAPTAWQAPPQARTWVPAPSIPCEHLATGTGPQQLPARWFGAFWFAFVITSIAAIVLTAAH